MKRIVLIVFFAIVALNSSSLMAKNSAAADKGLATVQTLNNISSTTAEGQQIINRLQEIQMMDKSNLTSVQRKELKKELIAMKERAKDPNTGIWIGGSGVVLILVIVLLIVLL